MAILSRWGSVGDGGMKISGLADILVNTPKSPVLTFPTFTTVQTITQQCTVAPVSTPFSMPGLVRTGLKVLTGAAMIYCGYRVLKWGLEQHLQRQRSSRAEHIRTLGLEVLEFMRSEADDSVPDHFYEEPVLPEGLIPEAERGRRTRTRHRSAPFIAKITHLAKNHFGGVPESTKANVMAVSKLVYELCKEHNCLPHQTRHIISVVTPLILTPDQFDISSRALLNSDELAEARAEYSSLVSLKSWLSNLLSHPLTTSAWRRAMDRLVGLPDWQAFRIVH